MYEDKTYEAILQEKLARVASSLDKREGSIIFDALAPVMSAIKRAKVAPYLAMALVMVYTSELTGLILSIGKGKKAVEDVPMPAQKPTEYVLPDNRRKADERKHGDYKISEDK